MPLLERQSLSGHLTHSRPGALAAMALLAAAVLVAAATGLLMAAGAAWWGALLISVGTVALTAAGSLLVARLQRSATAAPEVPEAADQTPVAAPATVQPVLVVPAVPADDADYLEWSVLEAAPFGLIVLTPQLLIRQWNTAAMELLAVPKELRKRQFPIERLVRFFAQRGDYGPGDPEVLGARRLEALESRQPTRIEMRQPSGRIVEVRTTPLSDGHTLFSYVDLTEVETARTRLISANRELSARLAELERTREALAMTNRNLIESQGQLAAVFENPLIGVALTDARGRYIKVNQRFSAMLGFPPEELLGKRPDFITSDQDLDLTEAQFQRLVAGEIHHFQIEKRYRRRDGSQFWGQVVVAPLRSAGGNVSGYFGLLLDTDERKQAEQALRAAVQRLDLATMGAGIGIWEWSLVDSTISWNDQGCELHGVPRGQAVSVDDWSARLDLADREQAFAMAQAAFNGECEYDIDLHITRPDGVRRIIRSKGTPRYDANGQPTGMLGIDYDVTVEREAAVAVQALAGRLEIARDAVGMGIWDWVLADDRLQWDDTLYRLFGRTRPSGEIAPADWMDQVAPESMELWRKNMRSLHQTGGAFQQDVKIRYPSGEPRWLSVYVAGRRDEAGAITRMLGVTIDITWRKNAEAEIVTARNQADAANRAKSEVLAKVEAELGRLLQEIDDNARRAKGNGLDASWRQGLDEVDSSARTLLDLLASVR